MNIAAKIFMSKIPLASSQMGFITLTFYIIWIEDKQILRKSVIAALYLQLKNRIKQRGQERRKVVA